MKVIASPGEMQRTAEALRVQGKRIGVVPTMGYLHEGHLSLIRIAQEHADIVVTTIFVNPTQFAPHEDFGKYPRDLERDKKLAESAGTDFIFTPETHEMYPEGYQTYVEVDTMTRVLEGRSRPTHFRGVTTVVAKLLNITKPHVAVFGQKDAQQAAVVSRMVKDLNLDIDVIVGPIVREKDGLAMSSRNVFLSQQERADARVLHQSLQHAERLIAKGERNCEHLVKLMKNLISSKPTAQIDYISIADVQTLEELAQLRSGTPALISLAVRIGATRLIDNILITIP